MSYHIECCDKTIKLKTTNLKILKHWLTNNIKDLFEKITLSKIQISLT